MVLFLFVTGFSTTGCSTWVKIKVQKAPESSCLAGVKKLKIEKFECTGERLNADEGLFDYIAGSLFEAAVKSGVKKITGYDLNKLTEKRNAEIADYHLNTLKSEIKQNEYFKIAEGEDYGGVLSGFIVYIIEDDLDKASYKNKDGKKEIYYIFKRTANVTIGISVTDKSGALIDTIEAAGSAKDYSRGETEGDADDTIMYWADLVKEAIDKTHAPFLKKIAPYYKWEYRKLANGDAESIKNANKSAKYGNWEHAAEVWRSIKDAGSEKDRMACIYNLGVYDEVEGRLQDALEKFKVVYAYTNDLNYYDEVIRIQDRMAEQKILDESAHNREQMIPERDL